MPRFGREHLGQGVSGSSVPLCRQQGTHRGTQWVTMYSYVCFFCLSISVCVSFACCFVLCFVLRQYNQWHSVGVIPRIWSGSLQRPLGAVLPAWRALSRHTLHVTGCDRRLIGKLVLLSCGQALSCDPDTPGVPDFC